MAFSGCAAINPKPDYMRTAAKVERATRQGDLYRSLEDPEGSMQRIEALLEGGITVDDAAEICLLNNPKLRQFSLDVGLAHADFVQSKLLSNPTLSGLIRFPVAGGNSNIEAGLIQNLIELWQIPVRKRLAAKTLEQTVLQIAYEAATTVAETKMAYYKAIAAKETTIIENENVTTSKTVLDLVKSQQQSGSANQVDSNTARSDLLEQKVTLRTAQLNFFEAKRKLIILLGLRSSPDDIQLIDSLTPANQWSLELSVLITAAKENRLDLQAAYESVLAAEQAIPLEQRHILRNTKAGIAFEREDNATAIGPSIQLQLPVFDQNQAQISKSKIRYVQALQRLEALTIEVIQQVRGVHQSFVAASDIVQSYEKQILPLAEGSLQLAQETFKAGKTGLLSVLTVQRRLLAARREYIQKLQELRLSTISIEASIGIPISDS